MGYYEKCSGCLMGLAVGDALGYPVENYDDVMMYNAFGDVGLREYIRDGEMARVSDNTQMTLFVAVALLVASTSDDVSKYLDYVKGGLYDWYCSQNENLTKAKGDVCRILARDYRLHRRCTPDEVTMSVLEKGDAGTISESVNNSSGVGGLVRVAPIGLHFPYDRYAIEDLDVFGAESAALTHGSVLAYASAAMYTHIVHLAVNRGDISLYSIIIDAKQTVGMLYSEVEGYDRFETLMDRALEFAFSDESDISCIGRLGSGVSAEEVLAIAVFCALRYKDNFENAIIASVNHGGNSSAAGSVCGGILGAYMGIDGIPHKFLKSLELKDIIYDIARQFADLVEEY